MMRRLITGVLAAALAGCTVEPAVSPLPTEAAPPPPVASSSATPSRPASVAPTIPHRPTPARTSRTAVSPPPLSLPTTTGSACEGPVVHTIDLTTDELALVPALCVGVGAVLRIEHIGPGEVTTDSPDLVDPNYEAGIVEIRFVRPGTVVVTIPQGSQSHDITVVVR
ncbi:hypothetical protein [Actinoplanes sp. NPDC026619]|uniref:hypothetical protein n=1 Tax=Actinoplanes sp. NPDC026619 TaxID=3155798 RepID=UPI0033CD2115